MSSPHNQYFSILRVAAPLRLLTPKECLPFLTGILEAVRPEEVNSMRYAVVIERAEAGYSAYVPDLPGCVATGSTVAEVEREIRDAIAFHLDGLREDGVAAPKPASVVDYIEVT
jgi:predicted RNase H-like HicB family nuclease